MSKSIKRVSYRQWSYKSRFIWLNYNSEGSKVFGVLSRSSVIVTNGFSSFRDALKFINSEKQSPAS